MKKWESFRINKAKVIENYIRTKSLMVNMNKFKKLIVLQKVILEIFIKFETRKRVRAHELRRNMIKIRFLMSFKRLLRKKYGSCS